MRVRGNSRAAALLAVAAAATLPIAVRASDTFSITIGVRETGSTAAIGDDGGTTPGGIEWINLDGQPLVADGAWHQFTWHFGTDPVTNFSGGNGMLSSPNNQGTLETLRILNSGGSTGTIKLNIDDIVNTVSGTPTTITNFEGESTTAANGTELFREPTFSATTGSFMGTGPSSTLISTIAHAGTRSLAARWNFVPTGNTSQWLRLTTNNTATFPNPTINFTSGNTLSMWLRASVYNPTGTRATGIDVSQFQGTIDWPTVHKAANLGGGGRSFAFIRAGQGGTTAGAGLVNDTTFATNMTNAKAAGMVIGPYHFGKPDLWTPNAPATSPETPEDDAMHYLQQAGNYMKPGYLRPVLDLEVGDSNTTPAQLGSWVTRFANTIIKYKGAGATPIIYCNSSYANAVDSSVAQYPLWLARWDPDSDWSAGDPVPSGTTYGVWDPTNSSNPKPWKFWQWYSPDSYVPGISGTNIDVDVAHGDINFVIDNYGVAGTIWDGSSSATWATATNWDTGVEPGGANDVLFDTTVPGTGSTITLSSGRTAQSLYFANSYTLSGGSLSLSVGRIDVDSGKTVTLATALTAPAGLKKVGLGTATSSGGATVTGTTDIVQGIFNVTGGTFATTTNILVDPDITLAGVGSSTFAVAGGTVTTANGYVGGTSSALSGGSGVFNVSSGSATFTGTLKVWSSASSAINLSGGSLTVASIDTNGDPTNFNWTNGSLTVTGGGGLNIGSTIPNQTITSTKPLMVTNTLVVASGALLTLNGGTVTVGTIDTQNTPARVTWTSGTFSITASPLTITTSGSPLGDVSLPATKRLNTSAGVGVNVGGASAGSLTLSGGTASIGGTLAINGSGVVSISSGSLTTNALTLASGGSLTQSGGTLTVPTLTASAGSAFNLNGGSATVNGVGASSIVPNFTVGNGTTSATFNQSAGSMTLSGNLSLGVGSGSNGTYNLSGVSPTLTVSGNESIGVDGVASFAHAIGTHTVGTVVSPKQLMIGVNGTSSGTYLLNNASAALVVNGDLRVGGSDTAAGGTGVFTQSAGSATVSGLMKLWDTGAAAPGGSRVNFTGGSLTIGSLDTSGNAARFNWSAGRLRITGAGGLAIDSTTSAPLGANVNIGTGKTLVVDGPVAINSGGTLGVNSGGTLTLGIVNVNAGGTFNNTAGTLTAGYHATVNTGGVWNGPAAVSTVFDLNGGTVNGTVTSSGTFNSTGGTLSGSLVNDGVANLNGNVTLGAISGAGTTTVGNGAAPVAASVRQSALSIGAGSKLTIAQNGTTAGSSVLGALSIAGASDAWTGQLDINDNDVVLHSTTANRAGDVARITNQLKQGLNAASSNTALFWSGEGIVSSLGWKGGSNYTGIGIIYNDFATVGLPAGPIFTSFDGQDVDVNDVLIKYTYFGDADLSGDITSSDYFQIDTGFLAGKTGWINGDFDYDGQITSSDYFLIDNAFLTQGSPLVPAAAATSGSALSAGIATVPEPSAAGMIVVAGMLATRRRQRRAPSHH